MKTAARTAWTLWACLSVLLLAALAAGQQRDEYGEIRQTVARISYLSGEVSFSRGDDPDDWQPADRNVPMTLGDRIYTGSRSRVEIQIHGGNSIRLGARTDLAALNLTDDTKQFSVRAGIASIQIRRLAENELFEVDTPNAAVTFDRPGEYRVDVDEPGGTRVSVRRGSATVAAGGGQIPVNEGEAIELEGLDSPRYDFVSLSRPDGWDQWVGRARGSCGARALFAVHERRHRRRGRPGRVRPLGRHPAIRPGLVAEVGRGGLGALPSRPLDLAGPVGMDLGVGRALGLGSLPLRPLDHRLLAVVLGARRAAGAVCRLLAGSRRLRGRRARLVGVVLGGGERRCRLVSARAEGSLPAVVGVARPHARLDRHQRDLRQQDLRDHRQSQHVRLGRHRDNLLGARPRSHPPGRGGARVSRAGPDRSDGRLAAHGGPDGRGGRGPAALRQSSRARSWPDPLRLPRLRPFGRSSPSSPRTRAHPSRRPSRRESQ